MLESEKKVTPSILVLVVALNEEEGIGLTLSELNQYLGNAQFLVVDGNSTDRTVHIAKSSGADVVCQEGKGKGDAICYALKQVKESFDYLILIDGDYTYPAEYIPQMIRILEKNPQVGMVCGNRFSTSGRLSSMRNTIFFGNKALAFIHNLINGVVMRDPLSGLRVIRWNLIKSWKPKSFGFDVEVELNHYIERQGFQIAEKDIRYRDRVGEKKLKIKHGFTILKRILIQN